MKTTPSGVSVGGKNVRPLVDITDDDVLFDFGPLPRMPKASRTVRVKRVNQNPTPKRLVLLFAKRMKHE